jgi:hypothetical protein
MQQPATAYFTCGQCNAAYDSDSSLRNHKISAHRWSGSGQRLPDDHITPGVSSEDQPSENQNPPDQESR